MASTAPTPAQPSRGKQRASRIELTYYKRGERMTRRKHRLVLLVLLLIPVWWFASPRLFSFQPEVRYTKGPVASVHAAWNDRCDVCHLDFTPTGGSNWLAVLRGHNRAGAASDQKCQTCHTGPVHHANQKLESTPSCASCHRDHQGGDFKLTRGVDSDCTSCHASVAAHAVSPPMVTNQPVTAFDNRGGHPEFRVRREQFEDPGKIKFNHQMHVTAGMPTGGGSAFYRLRDIADKEGRARYREAQGAKSDDEFVKLDCAACHVLDGGDFPKAVEQLKGTKGLPDGLYPPRAAGRYFQPINYENQCRACHPTSVDQTLTVPHRLQPDELHDYLMRAYVQRAVKPQDLLAPFTPPRPTPGLSDYRTRIDAQLLTPEQLKKVEQQTEPVEWELFYKYANPGTKAKLIADGVQDSERMLYLGKKTCGECHEYEGGTDKPAGGGFVRPKRIRPAGIPQVWFGHAKFSHVAHRAMNCKECHADAYADGPSPSTSHRDVLLPGIGNCVQCHGPAAREGAAVSGGVRYNCTDCHTYHDGDHWLQGIGAKARDPARRMDTAEFLRGGQP